MGKKPKAKKKDDYWDDDEKEETKIDKKSDNEEVNSKKTPKKFGFDLLEDEPNSQAQISDNEEETKKKDKKKVKKVEENYEEPEDATLDDLMPQPVKKGKKKGKKEKNDFFDELEVDNQPEEATLDDLMPESTKGGKKGKKDKAQNDDDANQNEGEEQVVKSAKQKAKEKKERQKQAQKLQEKKERARLAAQQPEKDSATEEPKQPAKEKSVKAKPEPKKGKPAAGIAALRKLVEQKKEMEEEQARLAKERRLKEQVAERLRKERIKKEEEELKAKKEQQRLEKEQLRKEGKLLTKAEKKAKAANELRLNQLLQSKNLIVPALSKDSAEKLKPNRSIFSKNINKGPPKVEAPKEAPKMKKEGEVKKSWVDDEDDVKDNWDDDIKESWDDGSESETESTKEPKVEEIPAKKSEPKEEKPLVEYIEPDENLRSPICCILGHVDTGKTKLLDKIRQTNVQELEAGGITQQIGATFFPINNIIQKTEVLKAYRRDNNIKSVIENQLQYKLPGLLIIDTPGHESFTNLRTRGSSLCNIAVLVVDIMHGLEPQTLESIRLLRDKKTPFIVALNKVDRLYDWKAIPNNSFVDSLSKQTKSVQKEFETRVEKTIILFAEQALNAILYYDNKNFAKYVSLVPTSAHTGEGIPDLLDLIITLTQTRMSQKLMYITKLECTVLEVKVIEGLGTTIDVILSNGILNEGDRIVVCGLTGPIVTNIRALLTPQPMKELRVKSAYVHHKMVKAALGVKISANDLEKAVAGSRLLVVGPDDDEKQMMEDIMEDLQTLIDSVDTTGKGVSVQASTIGSLEALLQFLKDMKIPVSSVNIGPIYKKDIIRASTMVEKAKEYAVILAFDVKIDKDVQEYANHVGVTIFCAEIIYHLFDMFTEYHKQYKEAEKELVADKAVFPCICRIVPKAVFNKKDPLIIGVDILEGSLRIGTPICVAPIDPTTKKRSPPMLIGTISGLEINHKQLETVKKGQTGAGVAVKIESPTSGDLKLIGRNFQETDDLFSYVTRESIDVLKKFFRADMTKDDWALVVKLKAVLGVS